MVKRFFNSVKDKAIKAVINSSQFQDAIRSPEYVAMVSSQISLSEVCDTVSNALIKNTEFYEGLAKNIVTDDLAEEIANHIPSSDIAEYVEVDSRDIMEHLDYDSLVDEISESKLKDVLTEIISEKIYITFR